MENKKKSKSEKINCINGYKLSKPVKKNHTGGINTNFTWDAIRINLL